MENRKRSPDAVMCDAIADGEANPFWTIEALGEHINVLWGWWHKQGNSALIENGKRVIHGKVGDFDFELDVVERYATEVFNMMAALLPELYAASEGERGALDSIKPRLRAQAQAHQARWDAVFAGDGAHDRD